MGWWAAGGGGGWVLKTCLRTESAVFQATPLTGVPAVQPKSQHPHCLAFERRLLLLAEDCKPQRKQSRPDRGRSLPITWVRGQHPHTSRSLSRPREKWGLSGHRLPHAGPRQTHEGGWPAHLTVKRKRELRMKPAETLVVPPGEPQAFRGSLSGGAGVLLQSWRRARGRAAAASPAPGERRPGGRGTRTHVSGSREHPFSGTQSDFGTRDLPHLSAGSARNTRGGLKPGGPRGFQSAGTARHCDPTYP